MKHYLLGVAVIGTLFLVQAQSIPPIDIEVKITDQKGEPVKGVTVTFDQLRTGVVTDKNGEADLNDLDLSEADIDCSRGYCIKYEIRGKQKKHTFRGMPDSFKIRETVEIKEPEFKYKWKNYCAKNSDYNLRNVTGMTNCLEKKLINPCQMTVGAVDMAERASDFLGSDQEIADSFPLDTCRENLPSVCEMIEARSEKYSDLELNPEIMKCEPA